MGGTLEDYVMLAYGHEQHKPGSSVLRACRLAGHIGPLLVEAMKMMSADLDEPADALPPLRVDGGVVKATYVETGNASETARRLCISRQTVARYLKKLREEGLLCGL